MEKKKKEYLKGDTDWGRNQRVFSEYVSRVFERDLRDSRGNVYNLKLRETLEPILTLSVTFVFLYHYYSFIIYKFWFENN